MNGIGTLLIGLVALYYIVKYAVRNGIIDAHKKINK